MPAMSAEMMDRKFMMDAAMGNNAEIQMGQMMAQKATELRRLSAAVRADQAALASACAINLRLFSTPYSAMKLPMRGPCGEPSRVS